MIEPGGWIDLGEGDEFAGYRIERRLGRGGMGILYLAVEPGLERRVALKLIAPEAAADDVFTKRFAEESRIAASIEHPNVVPIYAAGEEDGVPYIAMRYVAGSDLGRRVEGEGRIDPERAAVLIAQVGNGLDAIHAAGLIHRDVKPANVLLSGEPGDEHAYITDFGVARNVSTQSGLTQTGRFVGTLDYVAPEQISGGPVDARVDVYALGCLLFKLLTGQVPFPREGEAARLYAHLNDPPPAPSLYAPGTPMALDDVVIRAMSKQPGDRYPSAGDLGRAALAAVGGESISIPERTVATGAAATVEPETLAPTEATAETPADRTAETQPDPTEPAPPSDVDFVPPIGGQKSTTVDEGRPGNGSGGGSRRAWALAGGGLAVVVAVVLAIVLSSGGGGGGDATGSGGGTTGQAEGKETTESQVAKEEKKAQPQTLTTAQLIKQGDEICEKSQDKYTGYNEEFANGRNETGVAYSELLVGISRTAVARFNRLDPPPSLQEQFNAYVAAQEEVAQWDREALAAAKTGDSEAEQQAREDNQSTEGERQELAEAVGFHVCSGSEA
jgi:hypothetical protein